MRFFLVTAIAPLILTLRLDDDSFHYFNALRQTHFPAERNFLSAHLTLFHHLPPNEPEIEKQITDACAHTSVLRLAVLSVVSIGRGVAYKIECPHLITLRNRLQTAWQAWLTPQDRQGIWPHVTVQNKVSPAVARQTLQQLQHTFSPFVAEGRGLELWRYEGGPWTPLAFFPFSVAHQPV